MLTDFNRQICFLFKSLSSLALYCIVIGENRKVGMDADVLMLKIYNLQNVGAWNTPTLRPNKSICQPSYVANNDVS